MTYAIEELEGIGPAYKAKLATQGIRTTEDLLKVCADFQGRQRLASETQIEDGRIERWLNMADLMRLSGVGRQYAELLEAAGVGSVIDLRQRSAENLSRIMGEINRDRHLAKSSPSTGTVQGWVEQARQLDPGIET